VLFLLLRHADFFKVDNLTPPLESPFFSWCGAAFPCFSPTRGPSKGTAFFLKELSVWVWGRFAAQRRASLLATTA
ncbi:hypothetical protein, partial [Pseudomonas sp. PA-5-4H]|uniref:hypothetical protein n=1 Tax=Pseudomonas sp. PA-5-4H TaxID=2665480 RepID=UPI001F20A291